MESIPVIDVSRTDIDTARQVVQTAHDIGFLFIENYGMPRDQYYDMFRIAHGFFALPHAEKLKVEQEIKGKAGYSAIGGEALDPVTHAQGDLKEIINFRSMTEHALAQPLNDYLREHEPVIAEFARVGGRTFFRGFLPLQTCHEICQRLLRLMAIGLQIDEAQGGSEFFAQRHGMGAASGHNLRMLMYPSVASYSPRDIRAGAHTDYGTCTLLFQLEQQAGLEICPHHTQYASPSERKWQPVPAPAPPVDRDDVPPPLLVNIADLLSYWTGGYLHSTLHRVVLPERTDGKPLEARQSIAFFCDPLLDCRLEPIRSPLVPQRETDGAPAMTAGEYLTKRYLYGVRTADNQASSHVPVTVTFGPVQPYASSPRTPDRLMACRHRAHLLWSP